LADETLYTVQDAIHLVDESRKAGMTDKMLFNIKIQKVGGLRNAMKTAEVARESNIPIMIGGMFPSSYGKLANCHYAIALGEVLESDGVHPSRDYIDPEVPLIQDLEELERMEGGYRVMESFKNRPGFGARVNMDVMKGQAIHIDFGSYYPDFIGFRIK
jgi:L-alanine-DL-glutamate epimerase-like enolase superfamily enzyme